MFGYGQLHHIQDKVNKKIIGERMRYKDIYELIEQFAYEHECPLYNYIALSLILGREMDTDCFMYNMYSTNGFQTMKDLCDYIHDHSGYIVRGDTIIYKKEFGIRVDLRSMVHITSIKPIVPDNGPTINPLKTFMQDVNSYFDHKVYVVNLEISLINIYSILCTFAHASQWEEYFRIERYIFEKYSSNIIVEKPESKLNKEKHEFIDTIINSFIMNNDDVILIGEYALNFLDVADAVSYRIEILSQLSPDSVKKTLNELMGLPIEYKKVSIDALDDDRLVRWEYKSGDFVFLNQYNTLSYEVVNYGTLYDESGNFFNIGNIFCIFKLVLINIWIMNRLYLSGVVEEKYYIFRTDYLRYILITAHDILYTGDDLNLIFSDQESSFYLFTVERYKGINIDYARTNKIGTSKMIFPYYPGLKKA